MNTQNDPRHAAPPTRKRLRPWLRGPLRTRGTLARLVGRAQWASFIPSPHVEPVAFPTRRD